MNCDNVCPERPTSWGRSEDETEDGLRRGEEEVLGEFFQPDFDPPDFNPPHFDQFSFDDHEDDELLDFDFPSIDDGSSTFSRDYSFGATYSQPSTQSRPIPKRWAESRGRRRNQKSSSADQPTTLNGVPFVPDSNAQFSTILEVLDSSDYDDQSSRIGREELPSDEVDVTLAEDDLTWVMMNKKYKKKKKRKRENRSLVSRDSLALTSDSPALKHLLPSQQQKAVEYAFMKRRHRQLLTMFFAVSIIAAIAVAWTTFLHIKEKNDERRSHTNKDEFAIAAPAPISTPSMAPSVNPIRNSFVFQTIASKIENPEFLLDSTTPQGKAFEKIFEQEGIRKNRFRKLTVDKEWRILQRFSLMVVYFATGGEDEWFAYQGWRDFEDDECNWFGISGCEEIEDAGGAKYVTEILLTANNVVGKLPEEICLLKNLESIKINRNLLTGNIPECLSKLQKLKLLDLRYNQLDGTLPSGFFLSPVLEVLILSGNQLTGSIDIGFIADRNQIQALRSLRSLRLENNKLSGRIDPSILFLLSLNRLTLHGNDLSGSLDMICIRDLEVLTADCEQVTCTCCTQCY